MRTLLIVFLLALAGCTEPANELDELTASTGSEPVWVSWFFDADGQLVDDLPGQATTPLMWSLPQWLDGTPAPAWTRSNPDGLHILEGNITLWFEGSNPTTGGNLRPEFTAWWGSSQSVQHHVFIDGPDVLGPGPYEATSALRMPLGGFVVPPGTDHQTRVASYYVDSPTLRNVNFLTGGDTPSRLDLLVQPVAWPTDLVQESLVSTQLQLVGGLCAAPLDVGGSAQARLEFEVTPDMVGLTASLMPSVGAPTPDIDFSIYGPDGANVGGGHGSFDDEGAHIWLPNLQAAGPGTYMMHVYNCTPQVRTIDVSVTAHLVDQNADL